MRLGSLFAGIGGFDLAARWMGWETAWFSEVDPYASAVLAKHWPGIPNHGDIAKIDFTKVEPVDMLVGGFPCQDLSQAGKRKGLDGERSGLWSEYARAIHAMQPRWVVIENVPPLLRGGFDVVRGDLRGAGYRVARPVLMSASAVGAPHIRERLWIVAHTAAARRPEGLRGASGTVRLKAWRTESERLGTDVAHTSSHRLEEQRVSAEGAVLVADTARRGGVRQDTRAGGEWWAIEPDVGRVAHGIPARVDRLKCLGNAIVPQCAFQIFQAIAAAEESERVT